MIRMAMYHASQLIASSDINFRLMNESRTIIVDFTNDGNIDLILTQFSPNSAGPRGRLSLHFENITGDGMLPVIDIYLNLERENEPAEKNYLGSMALYGLSESSVKSTEHDGEGQERIFDAGPIFIKMHQQSNWSNDQFKLTLIPARPIPNDASLTIGRVALYFHQS